MMAAMAVARLGAFKLCIAPKYGHVSTVYMCPALEVGRAKEGQRSFTGACPCINSNKVKVFYGMLFAHASFCHSLLT